MFVLVPFFMWTRLWINQKHFNNGMLKAKQRNNAICTAPTPSPSPSNCVFCFPVPFSFIWWFMMWCSSLFNIPLQELHFNAAQAHFIVLTFDSNIYALPGSSVTLLFFPFYRMTKLVYSRLTLIPPAWSNWWQVTHFFTYHGPKIFGKWYFFWEKSSFKWSFGFK